MPLIALSRVTLGVVLAGLCACFIQDHHLRNSGDTSWSQVLSRGGYRLVRWFNGLAVGAVGLMLIASLLGAPWTWESGALHTALWALQAASVATAPVATTAALPTLWHVFSFTAWRLTFFALADANDGIAAGGGDVSDVGGGKRSSSAGPGKEVDERGGRGGEGGRFAVLCAKWALFGAWCGACAMPLDWGSAWLQWPLPLCYGTFFGHAVGCFAASVCTDTNTNVGVKSRN